MEVELQRTSDLFPFPSPQEASFHDDDDGDDDRDLLYAQNPWDYFEALNDDDDNNSSNNQSELASSEETESSDFSMSESVKSWDFGVWPCTTKIWSPFGSSYGSTEEGSSQEATPPTTPAVEKRQHVWDSNSHNSNGLSLSVVTENMEKMNIKANVNNDAELPKYPPISPPTTIVDHQVKAAQFYRMKHEILLKQQRLENNNDNGGNTNNKAKDQNDGKIIVDVQVPVVGSEKDVKLAKKSERPRQPRKKWQNYHQQRHVAGPGMRAVFLGGAGSKAGPSCGTGVFLPPCAIGNTSQSQSRKKNGCSPVLIPAKVMQALKDHFDRMDNLARQNNGLNFQMQRDYNTINRATQNIGIGIGNLHSQKKRQSRDVPTSNQNDIGLPQDWTY